MCFRTTRMYGTIAPDRILNRMSDMWGTNNHRKQHIGSDQENDGHLISRQPCQQLEQFQF